MRLVLAVSPNERSAASSGKIRRSITFIAGVKSEVGLYDVPE